MFMYAAGGNKHLRGLKAIDAESYWHHKGIALGRPGAAAQNAPWH